MRGFGVVLWTMFCLVFVFSAMAFTVFTVLAVRLSVTYFVYDFMINK